MAAITTFATFTSSLAALSVTGVKRKFTHPPASVGTADLPAMYPGLPGGDSAPVVFSGNDFWPILRCDLIVVVEPVAQNTQSANYDNTITILDGLLTALRNADIGRAKLEWAINANVQIVIADVTYWAVIATVEGR